MDATDYNLSADHVVASHFIFIATHDRGGHSPFLDVRAGYSWRLCDREGAVVAQNLSASAGAANAHHTAALLPGALAAIAESPEGSVIHFVTDQSWFCEVLNRGATQRISSDYRALNGKAPLKYAAEWRALDAAMTERQIEASAAAPKSDRARHTLARTKDASSFATRNIGSKPGDWVR
jgi:hypothetical protein